MAELPVQIRNSPEQDVIKVMIAKLANCFGITRKGNRVTVRWTEWNELVSVNMLIESVVTPMDSEEARRKSERYQSFFASHPGTEAALYYAEHGEWPK